MSGAVREGYKPFGRQNLALPRSPPPRVHPTGARVLAVLASSSVPLSVGEIQSRSGLARRTVFYWLSKLLKLGFVQRIGKPRSPGVVYTVTVDGLRALAAYRTGFERVQSALRSMVAGRRALLGAGGAATEQGVSVDQVGVAGGGGGFGVGFVVRGERFAFCALRGGRWVPLFVVSGLVAARGFRLPVAWWVVADGGPGFREVGFRFSYRRLRSFLRGLGVEMPRRVKRVVVYAKGKEVHVDAATRMRVDEVLTVGPYGAWKQFLLAFAGAALALLAAGVDRRFLMLLLSLLDPVP